MAQEHPEVEPAKHAPHETARTLTLDLGLRGLDQPSIRHAGRADAARRSGAARSAGRRRARHVARRRAAAAAGAGRAAGAAVAMTVQREGPGDRPFGLSGPSMDRGRALAELT